ncbi:MAG: phosphoribosylglycinamide formyltransferase [Pseudomonadota bacterium]
MRPLRVGVLLSGGGSNLQSIIDACESGKAAARVVVVISNVPEAFGLERARRAGVPAHTVAHADYVSRAAFEDRLLAILREHDVELVCLAGFMRLLTPHFVGAWRGRMLNIHPTLLPSFPGAHGQRVAHRHGVKFSGCTVHFVDEGTDTGPIVIQAVVPVHDTDTEEDLAARILTEEHRIYPRAIQLFAEGRLELDGRRVRVRAARCADCACHNPPLAD